MFKNDLFAKRFLMICVGVSMVLCSVAFVLRSVDQAQAAPTAISPKGHIANGSSEMYPFGIYNGTAYWLEFTDQWYFSSKSLTDWK